MKVNEKELYNGILCLNNVNIVPYEYFNFRGILKFLDLFGNDRDPSDYRKFNDRFILIYENEQ